MTRFRRYLLLLLITLASGCGGEKRQATVQPPPPPAPPPQASVSQTVTPPAAPPAPVELAPSAPDPISVLVTQAETLYTAGMKEYQAGNLDNARKDFDQALSVLLESKFSIADDSRLSAEFDKLVENIHTLEVATLERGDSMTNQKYVPAPIESLSGLTFPVDPRVKEHVQEQLHSVHSDLPLVSNDYVDGVITYFQGRGQGYIKNVLSRIGLFQPMISETLSKEGLPQDLIYLAGAESTFHPLAVSRARCVGIWQFSLGTGELYGLRKTRWVDERSDPVKSTQAAARHLKDLYQTFGDWYLAMAAYDSGALTVQRAIERTGYADFWKLRELQALPAETQNYVPIFLATAIIAKDPKTYGFDVQPETPPATDQVAVDTPTDLRLIAQLISHPVDDLVQLNPSLLRWTTPANEPGFILNLPAGTGETYQQAIASIPEEKRVWWRMYTVGEGETLASIAKKYRITKTALLRANQIEPDDPVETGAKLVLPLPEGSEASLMRVHARGPRRLYRYRVRKGDTLELIADRFDVTPYEIRRWNNLRSSNLMAGKVLKMYVVTGRGASKPRRSARRKSASHSQLQARRPSAQARKSKGAATSKSAAVQASR